MPMKNVTLVIYGWEGNEPGTLSWVFPSVESALRAVRALRNAVRWLVVAGARATTAMRDVDEIRRRERVLVERFA
jgi:hypothetical protein